MARTVFEIAQQLQNKIESDMQFPYRQKGVIRQSFLRDDEMPSLMTKNRLDTLNNRFAIENRLNTYNDELGFNAANMRHNRMTAENDVRTFGSRTQLADLNRQMKTMKAAADIGDFGAAQSFEKLKREHDTLRYQVENEERKVVLGDLDTHFESIRTATERQIAVDKAAIIESESEIEQFGYDREFRTMMDNIEGYQTLPPEQKIDVIADAVRGKPKAVRDRAVMRLREEIAPEYLETVALLEQFATEKNALAQIAKPTASQTLKVNTLGQKALSKMSKFNFATFDKMIDMGIIKSSEIPMFAEEMLNASREALSPGVVPAAPLSEAPMEPTPEPAAPAPAPVATTPEAAPVPAPRVVNSNMESSLPATLTMANEVYPDITESDMTSAGNFFEASFETEPENRSVAKKQIADLTAQIEELYNPSLDMPDAQKEKLVVLALIRIEQLQKAFAIPKEVVTSDKKGE